MSQMLTLFTEVKAGVPLKSPHQQLRANGWKKTNTFEGPHNNPVHVYRHPEHAGHEIHLDKATGHFEHKVNHGTTNLGKHLHEHDLQHSHTKYRAAMNAAGGPRNGWG